MYLVIAEAFMRQCAGILCSVDGSGKRKPVHAQAQLCTT